MAVCTLLNHDGGIVAGMERAGITVYKHRTTKRESGDVRHLAIPSVFGRPRRRPGLIFKICRALPQGGKTQRRQRKVGKPRKRQRQDATQSRRVCREHQVTLSVPGAPPGMRLAVSRRVYAQCNVAFADTFPYACRCVCWWAMSDRFRIAPQMGQAAWDSDVLGK